MVLTRLEFSENSDRALMNGKGIMIAVVTTGVALGGLILNGQRSTNRAIESMRAQINRDFAEVRSDIADLRERMARLEGLFEGHLNREAP